MSTSNGMRVHHLSCGTLCPAGGYFMDGRSRTLARVPLACHCLLIETAQGLVLVDTGLGLRDAATPARLSTAWRALLRPILDPDKTAVRQIAALGFKPQDVKHIVLTHLDFDHAGGLDDFPDARVHVMADELEAAAVRKGFVARNRYRPAQWEREGHWHAYTPHGERWFGFEAVRQLDGLPPEILLVPLVGHTWGHSGVAVDTGEGFLLHAGDAYFYRHEMDVDNPRCTPGLEAYQTLMEVDRQQRKYNQVRLRELIRQHGSDVLVFSGHDPEEFELLAARSKKIAVEGEAHPIAGANDPAGEPRNAGSWAPPK